MGLELGSKGQNERLWGSRSGAFPGQGGQPKRRVCCSGTLQEAGPRVGAT